MDADPVDGPPGVTVAPGQPAQDPVGWLEAGLARTGYRLTGARHAILGVMADFARPFTATELQEAVARRHPGVGRASVYRTLLLMEELGFVEKLHQPGSEHYTLCLVTHHHHHITCTQCGRTQELILADELSALDDAARALSYVPGTHVVAVYGICPGCQDQGAPADEGRPGLHPPDSRHPIGDRRRARAAAPAHGPQDPPQRRGDES